MFASYKTQELLSTAIPHLPRNSAILVTCTATRFQVASPCNEIPENIQVHVITIAAVFERDVANAGKLTQEYEADDD